MLALFFARKFLLLLLLALWRMIRIIIRVTKRSQITAPRRIFHLLLHDKKDLHNKANYELDMEIFCTNWQERRLPPAFRWNLRWNSGQKWVNQLWTLLNASSSHHIHTVYMYSVRISKFFPAIFCNISVKSTFPWNQSCTTLISRKIRRAVWKLLKICEINYYLVSIVKVAFKNTLQLDSMRQFDEKMHT